MLKNSRLRLGITLWMLAMLGVVSVSLTVIAPLLERAPKAVPLVTAVAASVVQSGVLVALAVWCGVALGRPLGLGAPVLQAALAGASPWPALRRQLVPAAIVGSVTGGLLLLLPRLAPAELLALGREFDIPLAAKLLYGGITEEVLMRWGFMTLWVWLPWRLVQQRAGPPRLHFVVSGVMVAAVLFGALHLPAVAAMGGHITPSVTVYVIAGNAVPGVLFGLLYWRYGLEAAILAHGLALATALALS